MKTLNLHCDYIKFKALKKALKKIEDLPEKEKQEKKVEEALVVLTAVEKSDEGNIEEVEKKLVENVLDISKQVKAKNIVLYPYAHLSKDLSSPDNAVRILENAEKLLKNSKEFDGVYRAPFGYYKEFELKVKGHPLSELSREIKVEAAEGGKTVEEDYRPEQLLKEISKSKLDTSKLKKNDHRILGKEMDLFSFHDVAPGMVFWHNNGLVIYNELIKFWRELHRLRGYEEIKTPQIMDSKLWKISGHWDKYKENNFVTDYEGRPFLVKPMNCPGGMLVYKNSPKSYKDLPLKVGEIGVVHRQELSGVLSGLFRVIQITQDDAHIFCTEKQLEQEIANVIDLISFVYEKFGMEFDHLELSTRPDMRIGDEKMWDKAENILEKVLKKKKVNYKINKGDGAFYGPKIDFHAKDSQGRTWQLSTIQVDFSMPERFDLTYNDKDNKKKRPVMVHRVVYGAIERFVGILLEGLNGRLPTWLAPKQIRVLSFTDRNVQYAEKIIKKIGEAIPNIRMDADFQQTTVQSKVKQAELMKVPYIIVVGDKEEEFGELAVREKGDKKIKKYSIEKFIEKVKKEIEDRE